MGSAEGGWGSGIIGLAATMEGLVLIVIVLRIYTRVWISRAFWWDDFTIILAVLGTTIGCSLCFVEVHFGFGKHESYLTSDRLRQFNKYTFGEWIQTFATLMWTKVSICLFLMRLPDSKRLIKLIYWYWCVGFLIVSNTVLTTIWIMQCQPVHAAWDGNGICMSKRAKEGVIMAQAIISIVSDFVFAAFPVPLLWRLQIDFKTKAGLWALMCLGFITGACCIVRTVLNGEAIPSDVSYAGVINWIWRLFEVQLGIIAACIPTLRPLYARVVNRITGRPTGKTEFDSNIRFLDGKKSYKRWTQSHLASSSPNPLPKADTVTTRTADHVKNDRRGHRAGQNDAMTQDLLEAGIISSDANAASNFAGADNVSAHPLPPDLMHVRKPSLVADMEKV